MWYLRGIIVLVVCIAGAFEDVFDEIPSQFEGWQLFMGLSADAQSGQVTYRDYSLQGVFAPKARIEASFQSEKGMWVSLLSQMLLWGKKMEQHSTFLLLWYSIL